jgi:hypothetical protein
VRKIVLENDAPFVPLLLERKTGETQLFVKQLTVEGKRYIVCRNEAEAEKDRKDREAIIAALDAQLKKGDKLRLPRLFTQARRDQGQDQRQGQSRGRPGI